MKLAILAPVCWRTPPRHYGPWEQVASNVAEGMVAKGLDVTLFATGDSHTGGKLSHVCARPYEEDPSQDRKVSECLHISHLMERAHDFDLIHNHYDFLPLTYSRLIGTPMLTTIHGFSSPQIVPVYQKYNRDNYYVSISNADRDPRLVYQKTIYNGIDSSQFTLRLTKSENLVFLGRIHPDKGVYEAIQIARKARKKLILCGIVQDQEYFAEKVRPFIDDDKVVFAGTADPARRDALLGSARALLHPIQFNEPFGLSVAEAMFCGTPVIAFKRGSMPELIDDGKTGFLVSTVDEAVQAIGRLPTIDPRHCRQWAMSHFSLERMVEQYFNLYHEIVAQRQPARVGRAYSSSR